MKKWHIEVAGALLLVVGLLTYYGMSPDRQNPSKHVLPTNNEPAAALFGYTPDKEAIERESRQAQTLRQVNPNLFQFRAEKDTFLYRPLYAAYRETQPAEWQVGRQEIGDCVSWGWAYGCDIGLAVMYELGESATFKPAATESIYGGSRVESRGQTTGSWSDGSYGSAAKKWVEEWGVTFRESYQKPDGSTIDLTVYSGRRAKEWGYYGNGGQNDNGFLDEQAKKHPVRYTALITTFEDAAVAIQSGYPVPVCSMQGFASTRDQDGFARASGSWAHCMCFIGVRYGDRPGLLCLNSWGPNWISGPKWPTDMPDGSFWVDAATATKMLRQNDSYAVSGAKGFPYRDINHTDWVQKGVEDHEFALAP